MLWGNSRGALVALLAGSQIEPSPSGVAVTSPIDSLAYLFDVMNGRSHPVAEEIEAAMGGTPSHLPEAYRRFDAAHASLADVPVFVAHASDDPVVSIERSRRLASELAKTNAVVDTCFVETGGHRPVATNSEVWRRLLDFLGIGTRRDADGDQ